MRKLIFAINITLDGYADHNAMKADNELHDFYTNFFNVVDLVLFGRKTYQLMEDYWPNAYDDPNATESDIKFADKINNVSKIVFSKTLDKVKWNNAKIVRDNIVEEVLKLKEQPGKNISLSGINAAQIFINKNLIDEYWIVVHPVILGRGKKLFEEINNKISLELIETIKLKSGVVALHYKKI